MMFTNGQLKMNRTNRRGCLRVAVATIAALPALVGCGSDGSSGGSGEAATIAVVASFYPLAFVVAQVGGNRVAVTNLTPAGAEPHDLELTPQDTAAVQDAELVVYLAGFSPALDEAIDSVGADSTLDVAVSARLDLEEGDEHDRGGVDPHFWLDPTRLADVADAVAVRMGELDSDHSAEFAENAASLRIDLEALDGEFAVGLSACDSTDIVTSHEAFGYLAERYGLHQVGIAGLSPEEEPSPAKLAEVTQFVKDQNVTTIYYETLVDPAIASTVAAETGATTAVLDPIEGLSGDSAGSDYFEVMRSNLESLQTGQRCT